MRTVRNGRSRIGVRIERKRFRFERIRFGFRTNARIGTYETTCCLSIATLLLSSASPLFGTKDERDPTFVSERKDSRKNIILRIAECISLVPWINGFSWILASFVDAEHRKRYALYTGFYLFSVSSSMWNETNDLGIMMYLLGALHFQLEQKSLDLAARLKTGDECDVGLARGIVHASIRQESIVEDVGTSSSVTTEETIIHMEQTRISLSAEELKSWDDRYELRNLRVPELRRLAKEKGAGVALSKMKKKDLIELIETLS